MPSSTAIPYVSILDKHGIEPETTDKAWSRTLVAGGHPHILALSTPLFTLDVDAVGRNIEAMAAWTSRRGVLLAPHGKTTMCPALWEWQLAAGAWGITVANEAQLRVARAAGVARVIVANEYLSPTGLAWLADELSGDPGFDVICWVDSVEAVELMTESLAAAEFTRPVGVCVEIGFAGARTGARSVDVALEAAQAVNGSAALTLRGVAGYEGSVTGMDDETKLANIRGFLSEMVDAYLDMVPLFETDRPIISAGGSMWFDIVVDEFERAREAIPTTQVVLRSGAYVVHDDGIYETGTPAAARNGSGPDLVAAARLWARVIATPEPHLAHLDVGKRDLAYDSGLPVIQRIYRPSGAGTHSAIDADLVGPMELTATNDQHAHVRTLEPHALRVGDIVRLGESHPCTMFDKWRSLVLLDSGQRVTGVVPTFF